MEISSSGDIPGSRNYHTMTVLLDGTTVMFGGYTYSTYLDDIYKLIVWVELSSSGDIPGVRAYHTFTVLHDGTVVMFGGKEWYPGDSYFDHSRENDIYQLSVSTQSPIPLPTTLPTPWPTQSPTRSRLHNRRDCLLHCRRIRQRFGRHRPPLLIRRRLRPRCPQFFAWMLTLRHRCPVRVGGLATPTMTLAAVYEDIARKCCYCGGGVSTTPSPTTSAQVSSAVCVDGVLSEEWSSGFEWTRTCVAAATMEIILSATATAEGKEKMCHKTNLALSGATFQSFVDALYAAGVATSSATFTLSCTHRRLASNNTRRLQDEFKLAARFTDEETASTVSEKVTELSPGIASEFESQVSTSIGVNITATISFLELTVESEDSTASACRSFPVLTLTFLFAIFFFQTSTELSALASIKCTGIAL